MIARIYRFVRVEAAGIKTPMPAVKSPTSWMLAAALQSIGSLAGAADTPHAIRWTPAAISSAGYESTPTFSPDGRELYFVAADRQFTGWRVMMSRCEARGWSAPVSPSFAAPAGVIEADPFFTPDGRGLYFISARQDPKKEDFDIWYVARDEARGWRAPERLPEPVNSPYAELLPRTDRAGNLYFGSSRPGGVGEGDIYVAERDRSGRWSVRNIGAPVSTAANEYEAEVSQDGNTLILVADRGDRSHLYRFMKREDRWHEVGRIPAHRDVFQVGPLLSPSGQRLLFAQAEPAKSGEMFLIDLVEGTREAWPPTCPAVP
jgi:hypothetical protein